MMLLTGNYHEYVLLSMFIITGLFLTTISVYYIVKLNKDWKTNQTKSFANPWAEWHVEKKEWEDFKNFYASDAVIKKDARLYALLAAVFFIPFVFLVLFTLFDMYMLIILTLLLSVLFYLSMNTVIYKVNLKKKLPFINADSVTVKGNGDMILLNEKVIFFNTYGLKLDNIVVQKNEHIYSALLTLEMFYGHRRITQEHRVPLSNEGIERALNYFNKLKEKYQI